MTNNKLKPCPFCNGESALEEVLIPTQSYNFVVKCLECGASSFDFVTEKEAIEAWNNRSQDTKYQKLFAFVKTCRDSLLCDCESGGCVKCTASKLLEEIGE